MARFVAVVLVFFVLAPTTSSEPLSRDSPATAWEALRGVWSWLFSRVPTLQSEPRKAGALVVPSGVTAPSPANAGAPIVPSGTPPPNKAGALVVPSG